MESTPQEEAEGRALVQVLAEVLERLVATNARLAAASPQEETKFHALRAPAIGIRQYLERIHKYASCSKECFVLGLVYIDRLIRRDGLLLTDRCAHRVVVTAVLLAAKFFDDAYYNNAYYARVGGVLTAELNALECEFLFRIDFSLRVTPEKFEQYHAELLSHSSALDVQQMSQSADEELCRRASARQQVQSATGQFRQSDPPGSAMTPAQTYSQSEIDAAVYFDSALAATVPQAQAPVLPTYSQQEIVPVMYSNSASVAPQDGSAASHYSIPQDRSAASHYAIPQDGLSASHYLIPQDGSVASQYPTEALRYSVKSSDTSVTQQQQIASTGLDPIYVSFPAISHQASGHQQVQVPAAQHTMHHTGLNLVHPTLALAAAPRAPQDASLAQYLQRQALPLGAPPSAAQAQVYAETEIDLIYRHALTTPAADSIYHNALTTPVSAPMEASSSARCTAPSAATTAPAAVYSHHAHYFTNDGMAASTTQRQPSIQLQSYPEITPSPHPPQPLAMHCPCGPQRTGPGDGAAYPASQTGDAAAPSAQCRPGHQRHATPTAAARPSRPIAIMGDQRLPRDDNSARNESGGWPCTFSLERNESGAS